MLCCQVPSDPTIQSPPSTINHLHPPSNHLHPPRLQGVLSVSWCTQDPALLLSSGKDHRTLCWDVHNGTIVTDTTSSQWNFDVQWSLRNPGVFSTSSFDGKARALLPAFDQC